MRPIILFLFVFFSTTIFAQTDSTLISNIDLINTAQEIQDLRTENQNLKQQNSILREQVTNLQKVNSNNTSILAIKEEELGLYKGFALNVVPNIKGKSTQHWLDKPAWNFALGVATGAGSIFLGAKIAKGL